MKPSESKQNDYGPFEHVVEESPEPMDAKTLDHDDFVDEDIQRGDDEPPSDDEWTDYDIASMSDPEESCSLVSCSPDFLRERRSVKVEKPRVRGIELALDDDSWIE